VPFDVSRPIAQKLVARPRESEALDEASRTDAA
jgi:hypothetical protein